jgi:hypothetical protein
MAGPKGHVDDSMPIDELACKIIHAKIEARKKARAPQAGLS